MELIDYVELGFLSLVGILAGWFKSEHSKIITRMRDLEGNYTDLDKSLAVLTTQIDANKEHMDARFDNLDKKMDKLFDRFEQYDRDREEFFRNFDLIPKARNNG